MRASPKGARVNLHALRHRSLVIVGKHRREDTGFGRIGNAPLFVCWRRLAGVCLGAAERCGGRGLLGEAPCQAGAWSVWSCEDPGPGRAEQLSCGPRLGARARRCLIKRALYLQLLFALSRFLAESAGGGGSKAGAALGGLVPGTERRRLPVCCTADVYRGRRIDGSWLLKDPGNGPHATIRQALASSPAAGDCAQDDVCAGTGLGCVALDHAGRGCRKAVFPAVPWRLAELPQDGPMAATLHGNLGYVAIRRRDWPSRPRSICRAAGYS